MKQDLNLNYASDDAYLSERFRLVGRIRFVWGLKAEGLARYTPGRSTQELFYFFKIRKYIKQNYKK